MTRDQVIGYLIRCTMGTSLTTRLHGRSFGSYDSPAYRQLRPRESSSHTLTGYPISDVTWSGRSDSRNDSCAQGSNPRAKYMLEILEMVCISYDPTWWSGSYVMNLMWSYVMNLTLVRLLFISHHEVSINISGKMTESSIHSLCMVAQEAQAFYHYLNYTSYTF